MKYLLFSLLLITSLTKGQVKIPITFTTSTGNTSAGIYDANNVLVKTLWSGVYYNGGTYLQYWDGTDDDGHLVTNTPYHVKILTNNVAYTWEGVIGNTSIASSGTTVHHAFQTIFQIAFNGSKAYYTTNYNEQQSATYSFDTTNIQSKSTIMDKGAVTAYVATDGNYVYWSAEDANNASTNFVYATKVSDNSEVTNFSSGTSVGITYSHTYTSAIDYINSSSGRITGIAVQKTGSYLFIAHQDLNQIDVLNKSTGAIIRTISLTTPSAVTIDGNDNLWVITNSVTSKFTVNSDGTLSQTLTLSGLGSPLALAVSPDNNTVVVCDGGSQQVKAFSTLTGSSLWIYGQVCGYCSDPTVANDKFYFAALEGVRTFINFQPDGSFWVGDPGNCRAQHFSPNRLFLNRIMFLPHFYSSVVDPNNSNRVFANMLEFKIDYSKSLSPSNNSWTLVKNWGYNLNTAYADEYYQLRGLTTLSNGRTYAFLRHGSNLALIELPASGSIRFTGIELSGLSASLQPDGSLISMSGYGLGSINTFYKQTLTGFDGSNNPIWSSATSVATTQAATPKDPNNFGSGNTVLTSSNILVNFEAGLPPYGSSGYHLGGVTVGDNKWLWRTARSTFKDYSGIFPTDGTYDIGNGVQYAGSFARALGKNIIWGYHGEFWKNSETNKWNHVYDDGLFVGQFGALGIDNTTEAPPLFSGNAFAVSFVKDSSGNGYVYLNDESQHSGIHRWKITGLNTIVEQSLSITYPTLTNGLSGQYFSGTDLNNFNKKSARIDATVNSLTNSVVSGNFSVRWKGFIKPQYSETYTLYTNTNKGVRLFTDTTLLIDHWSNTSSNEYSATITCQAGVYYPITLETINNGSVNASLSWSSVSQSKQIIPSSRLFPANIPDTTFGKDLMEGLSVHSVLSDGLYGWSRYPATEDNTDAYSKWWAAGSGYDTYKRPFDIAANFAQNSGSYYIKRDLGTNVNDTIWKISGSVNYGGTQENDPGTGSGMYIDILDGSDKIIARINQVSYYADPESTIKMFANSAQIFSGLRSAIHAVTYNPQNIEIKWATGNKVTVTYSPYAPVTTTLYDNTADAKNPKTFKILFYGNGSNYNRYIDVQNLLFINSTSTVLPPVSPGKCYIILQYH